MKSNNRWIKDDLGNGSLPDKVWSKPEVTERDSVDYDRLVAMGYQEVDYWLGPDGTVFCRLEMRI